MRTVQMTLDERLVRSVDRLAKKLRTTRSAFTRHALRDALAKHAAAEMDRKHREGYLKYPVKKGEFSVWENEQIWGDK